MQDRPTKLELLAAVRGFLESEVVPNAEGRHQFLARVAANSLLIVEREVRGEEEQLTREWAGLQELLGREPEPRGPSALVEAIGRRNETLCARVRNGDADDSAWGLAVFEHVHATVRDKLNVTNPGYLRHAGDQ